jgi:hypothetical protein
LKERASAECDTADRRGKRCGCGTLGVVSAEIESVCLQGNVLTLLVSADESWDFLAMKLRIGMKPNEKYPKN